MCFTQSIVTAGAAHGELRVTRGPAVRAGRTDATDVERVPASGVCRTQVPNHLPDPMQTSKSTFASGLSQVLVKQSGCKSRQSFCNQSKAGRAVRVPQRCTEYSCVGKVFLMKSLPREDRQPVLPGARQQSVGNSQLGPIDSVTFFSLLFFFPIPVCEICRQNFSRNCFVIICSKIMHFSWILLIILLGLLFLL